jgi:hypothetical protein
MEKEDAFHKSAIDYRRSVSDFDQKNDLLCSLSDTGGRSVAIRMISQGYLTIKGQPIVWCKLLFVMFNSDVATTKAAIDILERLDGEERALFRADCCRIIAYYADESEDELTLLLALSCMEKLGYYREMPGFIEQNNQKLGLDEEIVDYYRQLAKEEDENGE